MFCWFKKKKLFEYVLGDLNSAEAKKLEKHLKGCSKCRGYVQAVEKINAASAADDQPFLSEVFWRKFDERLELNLAQKQKAP